MKRGNFDDPQWELVVEIAVKLWVEGTYVTEIDVLPMQRFVDLQWAARQAGRALGGRTQVTTTRLDDTDHGTVSLEVRLIESDEPGLRRAEQGLDELMRAVLEESPDS